MLFLSSLILACAFSIFCGKALRKHPAPFYLAAAALSIGTAILANTRISVPAWIQQNIIAVFTKGILAAAFWAVIMWTGALSNGSPLMKKLMPQRGQLSIFAAILTLGHAVGLGISMLPRWLEKADALNLTVCIVLMLIMLPLTVISVQKIRRKMKAKKWKSVQRWAYLFYALIPVHVIALNIAKARSGRKDVLLNLMLYLVTFLGYAVCRIHKWYAANKKPERLIGSKAAAWGAFLVGMTVFAAAAYPQKQPEPVQPVRAAEYTEPAQTETTATASVTEIPAQTTEPVTASEPEITEPEGTETEPETTASHTAVSDETTAAAAPEQTEKTTVTTAKQTAASTTSTTTTTARARIYKDGTFSASAYGYDGEITVHVTVQDDKITEITAETDESDDTYFYDAKSAVIPAILRSQTAEVDACTGATYSSNGIMTAVRAALESAKI